MLAVERVPLCLEELPFSMEGNALYLPLYLENMQGSPILSRDTNKYSCTVVGTTWGTTGRLFDATDDSIAFGDTTTLAWMHGKGATTTFKWTFICWFNQLHPGTAVANMLCTNNLASANAGVAIWTDTDRKIRVFITKGSAGNPVCTVTSTNTIPNSTAFNCLIITYDQSLASANANLYLAGAWLESANKTANAPADANSTYSPIIGRDNTPAGAFDGIMGEMRIYNRVFTAAEALHYTEVTKGRYL